MTQKNIKVEREEKANQQSQKISKKDQIIALYTSGLGDIEDIAMLTGARPSYVASVLQQTGLMSGYFDLYTGTAHPMNVYSKFFAGKLGFKDQETAQNSVDLIDRLFRQFEIAKDRAGQHHAMVMGLTMFNRARWTGKGSESDIFRAWLLERLEEAESDLTGEENEDRLLS